MQSFHNERYGRMTQGAPDPEVGMGATLLSATDRHAATVTEWDPKTGILAVQRDHAIRTDGNGMSDMQEYRFERNPSGPVEHFRRGKDGRWTPVRWNPATRRWNKTGGTGGILVGQRLEYYDFSF